MRSTFGRVARCLGAVGVTAVYAIPLGITVATATLHTAEHVAQRWVAERDRLASVGLVHGLPGAPEQVATATRGISWDESPADGYVHEHDGTRHAHADLLGVAVESGWAGEGQADQASAEAVLALHLPAADQAGFDCASVARVQMAADRDLFLSKGLAPPLPPPRV